MRGATTRRVQILAAASIAAAVAAGCAGSAGPTADAPAGPGDAVGTVTVRLAAGTPGAEISPLILGVSGDLEPDEMRAAGIRLDSWGGNPASRYNYVLGNAWNAAADWGFRNTDYGWSEDAFRAFLATNEEAGVATRLVVPTLGWIARDDDPENCSFPDDQGSCTGGDGADCDDPGPIADPTKTSVESTPAMVASWVRELVAEGGQIPFIAMDNEPELWGHTHYDVHPTCPTYEEILDRYLDYAVAVRDVAPEAQLMGPVMCCWYDYWNIAPGPADGSDADFLDWFLEQVRTHDERSGRRTLDVVDVHFYPQTGVFNDDTDEETNARRLRSTRALWDPSYVDESWIDEPIRFIPRIKETIAETYPGTPMAITEWNFGADSTINGALAIADALGIFGREGVYLAAYWRSPPAGSPGYHAFAMHGNYDGAGTRFAGRVIEAASSDPDVVSAYGAVEDSIVRVMLVNKSPDAPVSVSVEVQGVEPQERARRFTYGPDELARVVADSIKWSEAVTLDPSSITVLELDTDV